MRLLKNTVVSIAPPFWDIRYVYTYWPGMTFLSKGDNEKYCSGGIKDI